jgi:autoinducer 2 (AI-2) kinase
MFDLARRPWSAAIVDLCGIGMHMLPEVVASGTTLGRVTASTSVETGLSTATLVVVGGGDTQLGLVGLGVAAPGSVTIIGGTFWQQTLVVDTPLIDPERRLRTLCHTAPDRWMVEGIGFYSGLALRWFRDAFCEQETAVARAAGHDPYLALERLAEATPPGANGLLGLFSNMMDAKRWVHAAPSFIGFDITDPRRSGKGAFVRAILEAAAYISRTHITILSDLSGQRCSDAVFTGGAARNRLWAQMLADVLNVRIHVPSIKESTALGAALYAGVGGGLFGNIAEAAERPIDWEATYEPDPAAHAVYDAHYSRWMAAYARSLELCAARLTTPLWQAAGA